MSTTFIFTGLLLIGSTMAISVQCPTKRYVVILFQPVTLSCKYQTSSSQPPVITWRYKSYCQDPIQAALNPSSANNALSQVNPNYNPNIECSDSLRTVQIVASKQGSSVSLGSMYQGRKISIINDADLYIEQTAWGDSGVYTCAVVSPTDLSGNSEDYTELIVLERKSNTTDLLPGIDLLVMEDWLLVVLVVLGFLLLLLLIAICWCQCCPHTCCCYVRCPCCPERCCCPRALYEAGKAAKSGVLSQYAPTIYAPSMYAQPPYGGIVQNPSAIPMLPLPVGSAAPPNGYGYDYDAASSVGQGSQVPLLQDHDSGGNTTRSGYRIQANADGNATRVLYYMERELANLDPSRPGNNPSSYNRLDGMSEVSSLHENVDPRARGRSQPPPLATVFDQDENMSTISSVSQQGRRDDYPRRGPTPQGGYMAARGRARSMDNLDDFGHGYRDRDGYPPSRPQGGARGGRRGSDDEWSSSGRSDYNRYDRNRRDYSPDGRRPGGAYQGRRSRSRDDLMDLERDHGRGGRKPYDDSFLKEALQRKKMGEQLRTGSRDRLDSESDRSERSRGGRGPPPLPLIPPSSYTDRRVPSNDGFPPPPPPYSEDESVASSKKSNLRKNGAVSRESLVV